MELKPGYKQAEVGVIPEDWQIKRLGDLSEIRTGVAKNSNLSVVNPVRVYYLRVANVQDGYLDLSEMSTIQIPHGDLQRYAVLPGDMLMNEGGDLDKLGRGAVWRGEFNPCIHQNHVFVVRCKDALSPEFLNIWTSTMPARRYFMVAGKQTTNLASINKTALGGLPVPVPSREEQRSIATALSDVDALITKLDQLIAKKRDIKQAAMQQLLTGKTRLPGFSGEWQKAVLGHLLTMKATYGIVTAGDFKSAGVPMMRGGDIKDGKIGYDLPFVSSEKNNEYSRTILKRDDVVLALVGYPGESAKVPFRLEGANISRAVGLLRLNKGVAPDYLVSYLNSSMGRRMVLAPSAGSAQQVVNLMDLNNLTFPLPPSPEQTAIAAVLSGMDADIAALKARRDKMLELKQGMMQELLTGRIRLPVNPGPSESVA